eukprot:SAG22_NODE_1857_length_3437_cov_3.162073_3_plen_53_part_00
MASRWVHQRYLLNEISILVRILSVDRVSLMTMMRAISGDGLENGADVLLGPG